MISIINLLSLLHRIQINKDGYKLIIRKNEIQFFLVGVRNNLGLFECGYFFNGLLLDYFVNFYVISIFY